MSFLLVPAAHAAHAPAAKAKPASHEHSDPPLVDQLCSWHAVHVLSASPAYVPAAHGTHAPGPASLTVPAAQRVHSPAPVYPASHVQLLGCTACAAELLCKGQAAHAVAPDVLWKESAGHPVQAVWFVKG